MVSDCVFVSAHTATRSSSVWFPFENSNAPSRNSVPLFVVTQSKLLGELAGWSEYGKSVAVVYEEASGNSPTRWTFIGVVPAASATLSNA